MRIMPEIRERWTQFLQGQLPADELELLGQSLDRSPELASALTTDAQLHHLLIEHFADHPAVLKMVEAAPLRSRSLTADSVFRQRCLAAVGWGVEVPPASALSVTLAATGRGDRADGPPSVEPGAEATLTHTDATAQTNTPPQPDAAIRSNTPPPVIIEPPPVCAEWQIGPESTAQRDSRWNAWLTVVTTLAFLGAAVAGWGFWAGLGQPETTVSFSERAGEGNSPVNPLGKVGHPESQPVGPPIAWSVADGAAEPGRQPGADLLVGERTANPVPNAAPVPGTEQGLGGGLRPPQATAPPLMDLSADQREHEPVAPNFIKDDSPWPGQPRISEIPLGRLVSSPDARWRSTPDNLTPDGWAQDGWVPGKTPILLEAGVAQIQMDCGLILSLRGPASFRFVSPRQVELIDGLFQAETSPEHPDAEWALQSSAVVCTGESATRVFVNTSAEFGMGLELRRGNLYVATPLAGKEVIQLSATGFNRGRFMPFPHPQGHYPGALAWANEAGDFFGQVCAFDTVLPITSPAVFAGTMDTVARRLREAPNGLASDWRSVVRKLNRLQETDQPRPVLDHKVQESGDWLPAYPDLQRELAKGLQGNGLALINPGNPGFLGKVDVNGRIIELGNLEDLRVIRQELQEQLDQAKSLPRPGNRRPRGRVSPAAPDFFLEQMLAAQLRQLEFIEQILGNLPDNPLILGLPEPVGAERSLTLDPVVASFVGLTSAEGKLERDARLISFENDLQTGLETAEQRERRLQEIRNKLHQ